jgi:hypothetical protein
MLRLLLAATDTITWIKVPKPTLDLVGIVISSLSLAGICAVITTALGAALGVSLILRSRRRKVAPPRESALQLLEAPRS